MPKLEQIITAFDRFLWQGATRAHIRYLSESKDLNDLERRMQKLDGRRSPFPYY